MLGSLGRHDRSLQRGFKLCQGLATAKDQMERLNLGVNVMRILILLLVCAFVGCESLVVEEVNLDQYENELVIELSKSDGKSVTPVSRKHKREDCPTGGWVGDGRVRTRCLDCDPAWPSSDEGDKGGADASPFGGKEKLISNANSKEIKEVVQPLLGPKPVPDNQPNSLTDGGDPKPISIQQGPAISNSCSSGSGSCSPSSSGRAWGSGRRFFLFRRRR